MYVNTDPLSGITSPNISFIEIDIVSEKSCLFMAISYSSEL